MLIVMTAQGILSPRRQSLKLNRAMANIEFFAQHSVYALDYIGSVTDVLFRHTYVTGESNVTR